jgi:nucleotidyltransferase/DNA polymerase involved in DNA repair
MRLLHLHWPHLLLRLARSRSTSFPSTTESFTGPIVLGGQPWTPGTVLDASPAAMALGVQRGQPLGTAHRLAPEALFLDPDPLADGAAIEAALERLAAFSPGIAGETDPTDPAFGRIEVQLDGLERLWGPEPALVERIRTALAPILPGTPRAGIAGTRFAALIAAGMPSGTSLTSVEPGGEAPFLAPLPAALLHGDPEVRARLARFGLGRIGQVAAIPRSALVARFGVDGELLHARSRGEETDPFRPRRAPGRMSLALPVEPAVDDLEPLRFLLHRLVAALADQLLARGMATATVHLRLALDVTFAPRGTPLHIDIEQRLPEPTAEAEAIERLLVARLERTPPPAPVARLELELAEVAPAAGQQLALFVPQAARSARLGWQLVRLALTFGEDRIRWAEIGDPEAPLPETRWRWVMPGVGSSAPAASSAPVASSRGREAVR